MTFWANDYNINKLFTPHHGARWKPLVWVLGAVISQVGCSARVNKSFLFMKKIQEFNQKVRESVQRPELRTGDIIKVHRKIKEGNKERIQVFEGIVIAIKGKQSSSPMVTVRRVSFNVGVEITVPLYSPAISKVEVVKRAKVRRSKLYYLRKKGFRMSKLKMKELDKFVAKEEIISKEKENKSLVEEKKEVEKKAAAEE